VFLSERRFSAFCLRLFLSATHWSLLGAGCFVFGEDIFVHKGQLKWIDLVESK